MNERFAAVMEFVLPVLLVALWWVASSGSTSFYFPPLSAIVEAFSKNWLFERVPSDLLPSLARLLIGYLLAIVVGVGAGLLLGTSRILTELSSGVIDFFRSMPSVALIPFCIIVFGIGTEMKIFVIFFGALWPILLNAMDGVSAVDRQLKDMARSFQIGRIDSTIFITLASALPQIFAGMRASLGISVIMMVISEMLASTDGIGFFILQSQRSFAIRDMWSGIILLGLIGYVLNLSFLVVERRVLHWHRGMRMLAGAR